MHKALKKCKRNVGWKDSVIRYNKNSLRNCYRLHEQLLNDSYTIDGYTHFQVFEPKTRNVASTRFKDRTVQRCLCDVYLTKQITKGFIYDNCACQEGKGTTFARKRLKTHLSRYFRKYGKDGYVLKCDLTNFFGSTPHKVAKQAMKKRIDDPWAYQMVADIIDSYNEGLNPEVGIGLGSQVTQLIELAILDDLDHFIKEQLHIKHYVRYNDDFILIHPNKQYLQECKSIIDEKITDLGLKLNSKKTQLFPLSQPIKFLGFAFRLTNTGKILMTILPNKVTHERKKLKGLKRRYDQGYMTKDDVDMCFQSWRAHAEQGNNYKVIQNMTKYYKSLWEE